MRAAFVLAGFAMLSPCIALSAEEEKDPWRIMVGGGLMVLPEFPGSDSSEVLPVPALNILYRERWFLNADGLGAYLLRNDEWSLSASVLPDFVDRDESDADFLRGTGDIDRTAMAQIKGTYRFEAFTASFSMGTDIANQNHGTVAELALQRHSQITPRFSLDYGISGRWISDEHAETFFGITPRQSLDSGIRPYAAGSGVGDVRTFMSSAYGINSRWTLITQLALGQLQGDAADSPIVQDDTFLVISAALLYRF